MSSSEASNAVSMALKGGIDPYWEYGERVFEKSTNSVRCKFCKQVFIAGIGRLKQHLVGIKGNCKECKLVHEDVKEKVREIYLKFQAKKEAKNASMQALLDDVHVGEEDEYDETMELEEGHSSQSNVFRSMKPKCKGPMDGFATRTPKELTNIAKSVKQNILNPKAKKKAREDVVKYIARWFYEAGIAFHTATLPSFQQMMQAIGKYGVGMEAPTPYELSETFLQKEVEETKENLKGFKESCAISGCTLMTDA